MKVFISYRFTGEDPSKLKELIEKIDSTLKEHQHKPLTTFWDKERFERDNSSMKEIMQTALEYIDKSDTYLAIVKSPEKSEGMLIEYGYAVSKRKKIILAIKRNIKTTWM